MFCEFNIGLVNNMPGHPHKLQHSTCNGPIDFIGSLAQPIENSGWACSGLMSLLFSDLVGYI